jgi:hypothetical protein
MQPQLPVIDSGPMVPICSPDLTRVREDRVNDSVSFRVFPIDFGWIFPQPPLPDGQSDSSGGVHRQGTRSDEELTILMYWCSNLIADCNDDLTVDAADIQYLIDHLYRGGPPPLQDFEYTQAVRSDFNQDGVIDLQDLVTTIYFRHGFADPKVLKSSVRGRVVCSLTF